MTEVQKCVQVYLHERQTQTFRYDLEENCILIWHGHDMCAALFFYKSYRPFTGILTTLPVIHDNNNNFISPIF